MANVTTSSPHRAFYLSEDTRMPSPLCFVLMPFGRKSSPLGGIIDFDAVYLQIITPVIVAAALDPIRADEKQGGGITHKPMFRAADPLRVCGGGSLTAANAPDRARRRSGCCST
jgi:hypothetical protein